MLSSDKVKLEFVKMYSLLLESPVLVLAKPAILAIFEKLFFWCYKWLDFLFILKAPEGHCNALIDTALLGALHCRHHSRHHQHHHRSHR